MDDADGLNAMRADIQALAILLGAAAAALPPEAAARVAAGMRTEMGRMEPALRARVAAWLPVLETAGRAER